MVVVPSQYRFHYDEAVIGCWEDGCGGAVATLAAGEVGVVVATADGLVGTVLLLLLLLVLLLLLQLLLLVVLALLLGVPSGFTAAAATPGEAGALLTAEAPCSVAVLEEDDELVSSKFVTAEEAASEDASALTVRLPLSTAPSFAGVTEEGVDGVANSSAVT